MSIVFVKSSVFSTHSVVIQDFSVIQILREINFGDSRSSKTDIFAIKGALTLVNFSLQKVQKFIELKIQDL